jgi:hypothetical protein
MLLVDLGRLGCLECADEEELLRLLRGGFQLLSSLVGL